MRIIILLLLLSACSVDSATMQKQIAPVQEQNEPEDKATCPRGLHEDPYPGVCALYSDKNDDGFCDLG